MAIMHPSNLSEYMPTESERLVYYLLKTQLPKDYHVFYSVKWTQFDNDQLLKSEADFIVVSPQYGFLCLEVKGGSSIVVDENNNWTISNMFHGERELAFSPYDQAEHNMYYFYNTFSNRYNIKFSGIYGAAVVLPFYTFDDTKCIDNRHRKCTIDYNDLNNLNDRIKALFKYWGGSSFGRKYYPTSQHDALMEVIREKLAISAAAGALIKYKEKQINIINRVQDNYIYLLKNIRQFFIKGGAGTGKTWIAMKMAVLEAKENASNVLFICVSKELAKAVEKKIGGLVTVLDYDCFIERKSSLSLFDAIFVDEAQDLTEDSAMIIKKSLKSLDSSRLGIFYDDVQVLREKSFNNGFSIDSLPYLLHENIRNTANIYDWASKQTNLGMDVILNPVEGPAPVTEYIDSRGQLTVVLENIFKRFLIDENVKNTSLVLLLDNVSEFMNDYSNGIACFEFIHGVVTKSKEISVFSVEEFKGLETDMAIYIHKNNTTQNMNYIAYTRAKYYLIELIRRF